MKLKFILLCFLLFFTKIVTSPAQSYELFPVNGATNVNPDTPLRITFPKGPIVTGRLGMIRIFDAQTGRQVDSLDLSIPAGPAVADMVRKQEAEYTAVPYEYTTTDYTNANTVPGTPSGTAERDPANYQLTIIGRFTDAFRFYPVIIEGNVAKIQPHHNLLEYGKEYYVTVEPTVFSVPGEPFEGIGRENGWRFSTKAQAPDLSRRSYVVSADGAGDFNTVQGAMDFIPDFSPQKWEVYIKNGDYEELVYFRNKCNVTLRGESRDGVIIHYANNETFNPHPINVKTNEWPGTFPSRRAAFTADNCDDLRFENLTIMTTLTGQAEGLLLMGKRNYLENVNIIGSGDALQVNGSAYFLRCMIYGHGDTILGRGAAFFEECTIRSVGPFMWIRNTETNHGNVFVRCTFIGLGDNATFARSPKNGQTSYPYAEAVLIDCKLDNIPAEGWGTIYGDGKNNRFWEYNSKDLNGAPIDVSRRHPLSKQLNARTDAELIRDYSDPVYVLGWKP